MKKKELLKILNDNTLTDEVCKNLIVRITDTLFAISDNVEIEKSTSIKEFLNNGGFDLTKLNSKRDIKSIQNELESILKELQTWVNREGQKMTVKSVGNRWLLKQQHKRIVSSVIFVTVFAVFALAVFVFSLLDNFGIFNTNGIASGICGSLDFLCGVSFFIYEWISDKKVKEMNKDMNAATGVTIEFRNSKIKVKGNNNNFGVKNTGDELERFIAKYDNDKIYVDGNDNNFGITR